MSSIPSISLEELSLEHPHSTLTKQKSLNSDYNEHTNRRLFGGFELRPSLAKPNQQNNNSDLPAWMREAAELEMTSAEECESLTTIPNCLEEEEEREDNSNSMEKLSTKLQIPEINWEKLNAEKNKTNKLLSEQRKALNREKTKASSRRRRKLTPSESPSHASLEKLTSLKSTAEEWTLTEEDEEEEEIASL